MRALVTNLGHTRAIPTSAGDIRLPRYQSVEMTDKSLIKEVQEYPMIEVRILEGSVEIDYSKYPINQLRNLGARLKIPGVFKMKKAELIARLNAL